MYVHTGSCTRTAASGKYAKVAKGSMPVGADSDVDDEALRLRTQTQADAVIVMLGGFSLPLS